METLFSFVSADYLDISASLLVVSDTVFLSQWWVKIWHVFPRRLLWDWYVHILVLNVFAGTLAVSVSFPLIFLRCFACVGDDMWGHLSYYAPFIAIFQFGWACTQIAHMALMSQLTQDKSHQTELSGLRLVDVNLASYLWYCYTSSVLHMSAEVLLEIFSDQPHAAMRALRLLE